uniref:Uncharacterized protein n=1 Tax=Burkholderia sp. (strain TH2) TaxID=109791 RepID=Q8GAZ2_BURST|nr:hypothetical protein [Burkholderia sp. TH2]
MPTAPPRTSRKHRLSVPLKRAAWRLIDCSLSDLSDNWVKKCSIVEELAKQTAQFVEFVFGEALKTLVQHVGRDLRDAQSDFAARLGEFEIHDAAVIRAARARQHAERFELVERARHQARVDAEMARQRGRRRVDAAQQRHENPNVVRPHVQALHRCIHPSRQEVARLRDRESDVIGQMEIFLRIVRHL